MEKRVFSPEWKEKQLGRGIAEISPEIAQWVASAEFPIYSADVVVQEVSPGSAADEAGVKDGDRIMAINGEQVGPLEISNYINAHTSDQMPTHVVQIAGQHGDVHDVNLTPKWDGALERWMIGIQFVLGAPEERSASLDLKEGETRRRGFTLSMGLNEPVRGYFEAAKRDEEREGALLERYVLLYTDERGREMQVDLLTRFGDGDTPCIFDPNLEIAGRYDGTSVYIKSPTASLAPHILAHEFRHFTQADSDHLQMNRYYVPVSREGYQDGSYWKDKHKRVYSKTTSWFEQCLMAGSLARSRNEARELLKPFLPVLDRLEDAKGRKKTQPTRLTYAVAPDEQGDVRRVRDPQMQEIDGEIEACIHELFDTGMTTDDGLSALDIVRLPTLVIERDAEYGALVALRALQQDTGIDLLTSAPSATVVLSRKIDGETDLVEGEISLRRLSIREIQDYMRQIGVNMPCFRASRAKKYNKKRARTTSESVEI